MSENLVSAFELLPVYLSKHLRITVIALALGMTISLPLAVLAVRVKPLRYPALTVVGVIQTIPSLALLALMVALLVVVGSIAEPLGVEIQALGTTPTIIALTLYSMLPMLRNTVTGILEVDPTLTEAARAVGMTPFQSLWKVELPLALPVIIAGIRTATVWTVGIATLATPVGQECLGNYIFQGLHTKNWTWVAFGSAAAAVLAISLDLFIGGLQKAAEERRRGLALVSAAALALIFVGGLIGPMVVRGLRADPVAGPIDERIDANRPKGADAKPQAAPPAVIVGSKTFTEQYILADLIAGVLNERGVATARKESLGSTVIFDGLRNNEVDCYVDYTGTIWANHMGREESAPPWRVLSEVAGWLAERHGIRCLGPLGFENAYALAMRRDQAERLSIETIADLAPHAPRLKIGGDYEFFGRPEWRVLRDAYGLRFDQRKSYGSTFMYEALVDGQVDALSAFSSDGRIAAYDLKVLDDPRQAIPSYDAILLLSPRAAERGDVARALRPLIAAIDVETMREANLMVDREEDPQPISAAARWLRQRVD
ncbi:MAG: glycine betaine ABC transporter substrate-binding protein [Planctomycetales bacterium]